LAEELSRREEATTEELYSLNPENIDWDSLGLGDFNFDSLPSSGDVGGSSLGVVRY
jgi:hypothetical protein